MSFASRCCPDHIVPRFSCPLRSRPVSALVPDSCRNLTIYFPHCFDVLAFCSMYLNIHDSSNPSMPAVGLPRGEESQDLGHQPLSLIRLENELRVGGAF